MKQILLVSDGFFHPPFAARRRVKDVLTAVPDCHITHIRHLNQLVGRETVSYRAMVLYFHHKKIAPEALAVLEQFVQNSGGLLAIHSATASFKDQPRYFELLGGRFTIHGPVEEFSVRPAQDGMFSDVGPFRIKDELYLHELQPGIQIHFETTYQGEPVPVVWTHKVGNGRVCYVCPGHRIATMKQPEIEEILRRGLRWVIGD